MPLPSRSKLADNVRKPRRIEALHEAYFSSRSGTTPLASRPCLEPAGDHFPVGINDAVRPYRVINAGEFAEGCKAATADDALRELVTVRTFDQLTHADDALVNFTTWPQRIEKVYEHLLKASQSNSQKS